MQQTTLASYIVNIQQSQKERQTDTRPANHSDRQTNTPPTDSLIIQTESRPDSRIEAEGISSFSEMMVR